MLISKKTGLIKPAFFTSDIKTAVKEIVINNNATGRAFLTIKFNDKTQQWDVANNEGGNNVVGSIKVNQNGDIRSVIFSQGAAETSRVELKCPIQKGGCCSSPKPNNLHNVGLNSKFRAVTLEENPNGEACQDDLEINAYYPVAPDLNEFISLISTLHVLAREVQ